MPRPLLPRTDSPSDALASLVEAFGESGGERVVVVDEGGGVANAEWFAEANDKPGDDQATEGIPSVDEIIKAQAFDMFGEDAIVGTPSDCKDMIADYIKRGRVTHLVTAQALPGLRPDLIRSSMQLFANEVIPAFR